MLDNPTPDPNSRMRLFANLQRLWNKKSAKSKAPLHTCNPTRDRLVDC